MINNLLSKNFAGILCSFSHFASLDSLLKTLHKPWHCPKLPFLASVVINLHSVLLLSRDQNCMESWAGTLILRLGRNTREKLPDTCGWKIICHAHIKQIFQLYWRHWWSLKRFWLMILGKGSWTMTALLETWGDLEWCWLIREGHFELW